MNWMIAGPEIFYFAASLWFLLLTFTAQPKPAQNGGRRREYLTAIFLASLGILVCLASVHAQGWLFTRGFSVDFFSQVFKTLLSLGLFLIVCICGQINDIEDRRHNEFYFLLFTCTLALMLLVSADHLLSIYVSLELSSYSLYILVALRKKRGQGLEAGIKYFLIGSFASAVMLFGMALLYSSAGTAYLPEMAKVLPGMMASPAVVTGLLFTLGGFFFKLAVFPFHFWAPDTYQGASNQVAAYIATASKVAGIAIILRVVASAGQGSTYLVHVLVILSVVSMTLGNLAAMVQKDMKRLLAFSTVAHSGYVLIGILVLDAAGYSATIFYALALLAMKFTAFMVVVELTPDGRNLQIEELAGLHRRSPLMALALLVALFSLAGIPPTIGFTGKFLIFTAAIQKGYVALVIIAMVNVVISLYYYLLVIKAAYLLEPAEALPPLVVSFPKKLLAGLSIAVIVVAGFFPWWLIQIAQAAAQPLMLGR
ncbi:MAG: NADH-quinone oxidoreductase subunit N [Syntrophobacteraceae bacterium]|nr:NADH-quinone oxidoreductase subunit N [Syntrophobacteraceae bacterium]